MLPSRWDDSCEVGSSIFRGEASICQVCGDPLAPARSCWMTRPACSSYEGAFLHIGETGGQFLSEALRQERKKSWRIVFLQGGRIGRVIKVLRIKYEENVIFISIKLNSSVDFLNFLVSMVCLFIIYYKVQ